MKTLLAGSILVLAVAACGGSAGASGDPASVAPATAAASSAASASPAPSASAAVASSPVPAESPAQDPAGSAVGDGTPVVVKDFTIDPMDVAVAGRVSLAVSNAGPTVHNLSIRNEADELLGKTPDLREGESETLNLDLPDGDYILFCSLPGHESLGMRGTLTVGG